MQLMIQGYYKNKQQQAETKTSILRARMRILLEYVENGAIKHE